MVGEADALRDALGPDGLTLAEGELLIVELALALGPVGLADAEVEALGAEGDAETEALGPLGDTDPDVEAEGDKLMLLEKLGDRLAEVEALALALGADGDALMLGLIDAEADTDTAALYPHLIA